MHIFMHGGHGHHHGSRRDRGNGGRTSGPDIESEQRVSNFAGQARPPYRVLRKKRFGDRNVKIELTDLTEFRKRTPILVDDIVSSGRHYDRDGPASGVRFRE